MGEAFFTEVTGPIPFGGLDADRPARVQGLPARPAGPRQADGGPPPARRLLLALVRVAGRRHVRHRHARPAVARRRPTTRWRRARTKMAVAFEFFEKLGTPYYCFHDRDVAPEGDELREFRANLDALADDAAGYQERTGVAPPVGHRQPVHPPALPGAARRPTRIPRSSPTPRRRSSTCSRSPSGSAAQNYVLWGGREGYDTLLNTDLRREGDQLARFLHLVAEHKHKIGFEGQLLIEPKPMEPTKHQYDYDVADRPRLPRQPRARGRVPGQHRGQPRHARRAQLPPRGRVRGRQRDARQHRRQPRRPAERLGHRPVPELGRGPRAAAVRDPARRRPRARRLQLRRQAAPPEHRPDATCSTPTSAAWTRSPGPSSSRPTSSSAGELAALKDARYAGWDGELGPGDPRRLAEPRRPRGAGSPTASIDPRRVVGPPGAPREPRQPADLGGRPGGPGLTDGRRPRHRRLDHRDQGRPRRRGRAASLAIGTSEYGFDSPHPLWSEQDPQLWWDGAIDGDPAPRWPRRASRRRRRRPSG